MEKVLTENRVIIENENSKENRYMTIEECRRLTHEAIKKTAERLKKNEDIN